MAGTNLRDARTWLSEKNTHFIGCHDWDYDGLNKDSIKMVEGLYEKGATKIEVDIYNEEDDFACEMFVTLPKDKQKTKEILCYLGELHADEVSEDNGVAYVAWGD